MTESSEQYALLLADLWGRERPPSLIVRQVPSELPSASRLLLAVDAEGRRHVLAPIAEDYAFVPERGQSVELTDWHHPQTTVRYLDLLCLDETLTQAFEQLTDSIIDRVERRQAPHIAMQEALFDMRNLLKRSRLLTEEAARGIFGELAVLGWLAERNPIYALEAWTGPEGHVHDFSTKNGDLEVKSAANGSRVVVISSLEQLDEVADTPLALVRLHLQSAPQGENLGDAVERLVTSGCNRADLVAKLEAAGFRLGIDSDEHRFVLEDEPLAWRVGPDFPGLRSSDLPDERRNAILRVTYSLDLLAATGDLGPVERETYFDGMMTP